MKQLLEPVFLLHRGSACSSSVDQAMMSKSTVTEPIYLIDHLHLNPILTLIFVVRKDICPDSSKIIEYLWRLLTL